MTLLGNSKSGEFPPKKTSFSGQSGEMFMHFARDQNPQALALRISQQSHSSRPWINRSPALMRAKAIHTRRSPDGT
jgi:hypothetical protein